MRRDRIKPLWPIYGDVSMADDDIRKLNHTGTHPVHTDLGINDAIDFHQGIGIAAQGGASALPAALLDDEGPRRSEASCSTRPQDPARSCAIANVGVEGITPAALAKTLFDKYRIWTVAIDGAGVHGVRITPQLFTTTGELDQLVRALREIAAGG